MGSRGNQNNQPGGQRVNPYLTCGPIVPPVMPQPKQTAPQVAGPMGSQPTPVLFECLPIYNNPRSRVAPPPSRSTSLTTQALFQRLQEG